MKLRSKLYATAIGGSFACFGVVMLFRSKVSSEIKKSKSFEEAMDFLRHHRGALYLLGDPITESTAKFASSGWNDSGQKDVQVNVVGPKSNGILFYSVLPDKGEKMQLDKVQLQIGKDDSKRLVIKKPPNETTSSSEVIKGPEPKENTK